jgi:lysophospholipase L1-like esterase
MPNSGRRRSGPTSLLANLALAGLSLLMTGVALEVGVRLFPDSQEQKPFAVYDIDHTSGGLSFLPGRSRHYETPEFSIDVHYNAFGRRDGEWPPAVVADPESVIVIGDSNVYGIGVGQDETIPSQLEALFAQAGHPVEVMNFGMPGRGAPPTYSLLLDDAIAKGFAARTVVVAIFVGNDFYPEVLTDLGSDGAASAPAESSGGGSLLARWKSFQMLKTRLSQSARMVGWALTLGRMAGVSLYDSAGTYVFLREQTPEQQALFRRILRYIGQMKERCDATGRRLFAVILPNRIQVENRDALTGGVYDATRPHRDILRYCDEIGIPCLDLLPPLSEAYENDGAPLFYAVDRHPNPHGARLIAETIARFLRTERVL